MKYLSRSEREWKDTVLESHPDWLVSRLFLDAMWQRGLSVDEAIRQMEACENSNVIREAGEHFTMFGKD